MPDEVQRQAANDALFNHLINRSLDAELYRQPYVPSEDALTVSTPQGAYESAISAANRQLYTELGFALALAASPVDELTVGTYLTVKVGGQIVRASVKLVDGVKSLVTADNKVVVPDDPLVQIWAYQGGRGDTKVKVLENPDPSLRAEAYTGHVGVSIDGGKTIYGFGPNVTSTASKSEVITSLRNLETYPGHITDDTILFNDIINGRYDPSNAAAISLYRLDVPVSPAVWRNINNAIQQSEIPNVRYGFPGATHPTATVRNCATAFGECGLTLPSNSGQLTRDYIPAMQVNPNVIQVR